MNGQSKEGSADLRNLPANSSTETLQLFSHDIRAAMSDVIGGLRLVDRDRLDLETLMQIDRVLAAGDTLASLVDAALMAAAGDTIIQTETPSISLNAWLSTLKGRWSGQAREKNTEFKIETSGDLPHMICAPQITLDRIVGNLIANALIHANGQKVRLDVRAQQGEGLILAVHDEGPGYPHEILRAIEDGADRAPIGQRSGHGLGLRIAAEFTRHINGTLRLSNATEGSGGTAEVHLPERILAWSTEAPVPCVPPDLSGLKLLVAEDNLTNQTILRQLLAKMQADVTFVADGVAALESIEQNDYDVALIDIEMPRASGIEVMERVRARDDDRASMPLVALTAYVLRDNREAIYAAGADGIIGKPISSGAEFGRAILRYAGRPTDLLEPEDVLNTPASPKTFGAKLDKARFDDLMEVAGDGGRPELLSRLFEDLTAVKDALDQGVTQRSIPEIRSQTHILIAISGAVGADRLNELAEVLNIAAKRKRMDDLDALYAPCRRDLSDLLDHVEHTADHYGVRQDG